MKPHSKATGESPASQLAAALAKFDPAVAGNALAIGWGATERASGVIVSLAVYASGVNLYFMHGARLPDPTGLLQGSGRQDRFVRLSKTTMLTTPAVAALLDAATAEARPPLPSVGRRHTVIKAVAVKQRARRRGS